MSFGSEFSTSGTMNAPQPAMNVTIAVTATPGSAIGRITRSRIWRLPAPSSAAASSNSSGIWSMKFFSSQIANGSEPAARNSDV